MCLAQGPQRSDAGDAQPRGLSVSSQAPKLFVKCIFQQTITVGKELI